jgi:hypothetical protein
MVESVYVIHHLQSMNRTTGLFVTHFKHETMSDQSFIQTPYRQAARIVCSLNADVTREHGQVIASNRDLFASLIMQMNSRAMIIGCHEQPEMTKAFSCIKEACELFSQAYIASQCTVKGVPFDQAVQNCMIKKE